MSEFQEVMRQAKRMCDAQAHCGGCPAIKTCFAGLKNMEVDDDRCCEYERVVMQWAEEHPEPRYPSWNRWFRETFPNSVFATSPCPNTFCRICNPNQYHSEVECHKCKNDPIPAGIAEKLGIKPIGGAINEE